MKRRVSCSGHGILGPEGYALPLRAVPCLQHPHLQLRGVEASGSDGLPLLRGITLEAGATEVLAIMATTEKEGKRIVETIAGRKRIKRGDILLNGRSVSSRSLRYCNYFNRNPASPFIVSYTNLPFLLPGPGWLTYPQRVA